MTAADKLEVLALIEECITAMIGDNEIKDPREWIRTKRERLCLEDSLEIDDG